MKASKIAENIIQYFARTRGVGHTDTMLSGVRSVTGGVVVLSATESHAQQLYQHVIELSRRSDRAPTMVSLENTEKLVGLKLPLVFDNHATVTLLQDLLEQLYETESIRDLHAQNLDKAYENLSRASENLLRLYEHISALQELLTQEKRSHKALLAKLAELVNSNDVI